MKVLKKNYRVFCDIVGMASKLCGIPEYVLVTPEVMKFNYKADENENPTMEMKAGMLSMARTMGLRLM